MKPIGEYWDAAAPLLAGALIILLWLAVLHQFAGAMLPRLNEIGAHPPLPLDRPCDSPQCDFSAFWPAGVLARAHHTATLYDPQRFWDYRRAVLTSQAANTRWIYPPVGLLPSAAISFVPFESAFWVWTAVSLIAAAGLLRGAGLPWSVITVGLLSPAALWNTELGQFGTLMGAALVAGLLLANKAPVRAGSILALLLVKPQYGVLLPVAFAAGRQWRAMVACAIACVALVAATTALTGPDVWRAYITIGMPVAQRFLETPPSMDASHNFGLSVFWMLRSFGAGVGGSYAAQTICSLLALTAAMIWRRRNLPPLDVTTLVVMLTLLASPYGYTDDMVGFSVVLAARAQRRGWRLGLLDVLFWLWPFACPIITARTGSLLTPVVVALALARAWREAKP